MLCPACGYEPVEGEGDGVSCPSCRVYYHKVLARQLEEARKPIAQRKAELRRKKRPAEPAWWRLVKLFAFALLMLVFLFGMVTCVMRDTVSTSSRMDRLDAKVLGRGKVLDRLRDPSSAVFSAEVVGENGVLCGQVNAKNGFGGYIGNKRFISGAGGAVIEGDIDIVAFAAVWNESCRQ